MRQALNIKFEEAVRLLTQYFPVSAIETRKPILPHVIRVGVYLYERDYSDDLVLAGLLHDALEFTQITEQILEQKFGQAVAQLVMACTKNDSIQQKEKQTEELIKRCIQNGQNALVVKAADIIDSFKYYNATNNKEQIQYCLRNTHAIFQFIPADYNDKIFIELKEWQTKCS